MRTIIAFFISTPLKLATALVINFLLFILIPLTHNLFGIKEKNGTEVSTGPRIIAEIIRPPKKEEKKQLQPRIRQVNTSSGNKGTSNRMDFKFTPDLGIVEGEGVAIEQQGTMDAIVFEAGEVDENATLITPFQIPYPQRALELGIEGTLEAYLTVGIDGKVIKIEIIVSPHSSITNQARKVFNGLRFKPAKNKGIPVIMKLKQVVEFKLDS